MSKEQLYELVDALPESEVYSAERYLQFLLVKIQNQRILEAFENAPEEDEAPDAAELELEAIKEAEKDIAKGKVEPFDKVMKDLGV